HVPRARPGAGGPPAPAAPTRRCTSAAVPAWPSSTASGTSCARARCCSSSAATRPRSATPATGRCGRSTSTCRPRTPTTARNCRPVAREGASHTPGPEPTPGGTVPDELRASGAVLGAGAVGCYFGGMLARAGAPVTLIGRPHHVEAMASDGLWLETLHFQEWVRVGASVSAEAARGAAVVLLAVKT